MILFHGTKLVFLEEVVQITNYRENIYTAEQAAKALQDKFLDQQYYFGTEKALNYLTKTKVQAL